MDKKNILIAPLNWGLGHATRCIPIIKALQSQGFTPIIASDGNALALLKKEFPEILCLELPSYQIEYSENEQNFKWKLIKNSPKILDAIVREKKLTKKWVKTHNLIGIISDNRLGVRSKKVRSVFITHQLNVLSGNTTWISSKLHQKFIKKYDECWVPDVNDKENLSGKLGHLDQENPKIRYIGPLSRFNKRQLPKKYDLMVVLSGPEPQRTLLEEKLIVELQQFKGEIVFVKGLVEEEQTYSKEKHIMYYNYMTSEQLEIALNESELILSRSGYTTIMDLTFLEKKAFFIPTPGQFEQEYLAKKFQKEGKVPYRNQDEFVCEDLKITNVYYELDNLTDNISWEEIFNIFRA